MIIDQLFTRPLFEQAPMASPEQLAYNRLRAQYDGYQAMTSGGGNTAVSRDPAHAAKLAKVPAELARMAAALKAKGIDAEAQYDALGGPKAAPVDANQLYEFAPSDDGDGPDQEELLRRMAAHWWNGNERQMAKVENTLAAMGWEIGQDEGYDEGGVFVVRAGDEHGRTYTSWSADELEMNEAAPPGARAERMVKHIKAGYAKDGKLTPKEKGIAFATAWKAHNAGRVEEGEITKNATGLKHRATDKYGAGDDEPHHYTGGRSGFSEPGKYARDLEHVNKQLVKDLDASMGISWKNRGPKGLEVDEQGVTEGEYDSRKPFGVRYKVFAGREGRMTTREYWTSSEEKLQRAVDKIQALDNFYEIDGYSYPKESQDLTEVFADQGSGSTDRDNADYMKRRNAAKKAGYTGRETKAGTWRVFKDGNAVAVAGPFKSADEAAAWIKKHKQGVTEGVAETVSMDQAKKVLRRYGADHFKTTSNELHFYKNGRHMSVDLIFNDDATRSVSLSQMNSATRKLKGQGITEMDKSQPAPGRDIESPPGPDKEAKPVAAKKATRDAGRMLNKAFRDAHKKKDVKEANQEIYSTVPFELARTAPGIQMAKMAGQSAVAAAKNKLDSLKAKNPEQWDKAMQKGSARMHGPPPFPADAGWLPGDRAEYMKKVKSAPSEWDDTTGSIGMDPQMKSPFPPLMKKLQAAMVREGRVKELADDLKTMSDADFMKKYGKAKAAIRKDMKRIDEKLSTSDTLSRPAAGASSSGKAIDDPDIMGSLKSASTPKFDRFSKTDGEPKIDFRAGLVGSEPEVEAEPRLMVDPLPDMQKWGGKFATGNAGGDNRFTAPAGWRYVEKDEDPARYGSAPAAAAAGGGLPDLKYDPQSRTLKSADALALDLSPKSKFKFDRTTQSQVSADGSGGNPNIDNVTRDRARAWAARQNAPVDAAKKKTDWKTIYALNKATIGTNPNLIRPGMKLKMPDGSTYPVQPGDNLSKIAAKQSQINEQSALPPDQTARLAPYLQKGADGSQYYNLPTTNPGETGAAMGQTNISPAALAQIKSPQGQQGIIKQLLAMTEPKNAVPQATTTATDVSDQYAGGLNELSTNKLAQYKTAAAKDAKEADKAGDFKRGDKRFGGIVQATKKQFDNDAKKVDESRAARRALMARIANSR